MHFISELCENGTVKVSPEPSKYTAVMKYRYVHIVLCSLPTSVHIFNLVLNYLQILKTAYLNISY